MADGVNPNNDELNQQAEAGAAPVNPAEGVTPTKPPEEIKKEADIIAKAVAKALQENDEKKEAEAAEHQRAKQAQQIEIMKARLKYFYEEFGYKGEPDKRMFDLIAGVDMQGKNMVTFLKDGKSAIIDTGKGVRMSSPEFNDDAAQVLASQILAKKWESIKVGGTKENRFKLAASLLSLDPNAKITGIKMDEKLLEYAQMLRNTRGLGNGEQNQQNAQSPTPPEAPTPQSGPANNNPPTNGGGSGQARRIEPTLGNIDGSYPKEVSAQPKTLGLDSRDSGDTGLVSSKSKDNPPSAPSGNTGGARFNNRIGQDEVIIDVDYKVVKEPKLLPHTPDFPVAGQIQQEFETNLSERALALEDMRQDKKFRGVSMNAAQFREFDNINTVLGGIQNATPQERAVFQRIIKVTTDALKTAPKENIPTILEQASALVDQVQQAKAKEAEMGKKNALGIQGIAALPLDNIRKTGLNGPSMGPKPSTNP